MVHNINKSPPLGSQGLLKRWSPFMGCCRRDLRPAMELRCPPVRETAGWVQLPNCGLAPAGRSGVGSCVSCLDILVPYGWGYGGGDHEETPVRQRWVVGRGCTGKGRGKMTTGSYQ